MKKIKLFISIFCLLFFNEEVISQNVGIGTNNPAASLHVADSNVLFTGPNPFVNYSPSQSPPVQGAGTRLMWYPQKGAFRAGWVEDNRWDKDSIGIFSMAFGHSTLASSASSTAFGLRSSARGMASTAFGYNSSANNDYSIAAGYVSRADAPNSIALGNENLASGYYSTSIGIHTVSSGNSSFAAGDSSIASGTQSIAAGAYVSAKARASFVTGWYNDISDNPDPTFISPTDRIFQIGNGNGFTLSRSNALTILRNGNMGIGTTTPANKISVSGTSDFTGNMGIGTPNTNNTYGLTGNIRSLEIQNTNAATDSRSVLFLSTAALSGNVGSIQFGSPSVVTNYGMLGYISCVYETSNDDTNPSTSLIFSTRSPLTNPTRMIIKGNGHIGIGTSTPGFPLNFSNELGDKISFYGNNGNHYGLGIQSGLLQIHTDHPVADIVLGYGSSTSFTETMRIKGNGLVGIGTNNPTKKTEIIGNSASPVTLVVGNRNAFGPASMEFVSDYGLTNQWRPGYIRSNDAGGFTGTLEFYTNGTGAGNLYGTIKGLEVRNGVTYTATGTVSSWSDARLKKNIQPFTAGLDVINKINPVSFNYNNFSPFNTDKKQIGIIAQELEKTAPYMVDKTNTKDFEELRSVNNQAYLFLLINAVKELAAQNEKQQKEIETLKRMIKN